MSMTSPEARDPAHDLLRAPPRPPPGKLSDEPRYRALRSEIDRAQEMTGAATDWAKVEELGRALLREGFDDLLVAAYTARAAQESAPLGGVRLGLALFVELLGARWTSASPPERRLRARVSALRWWIRSSTEALRHAKMGARHTRLSEPGDIEKIEAALARLEEITVRRIGDSAPALGALRRELRRLRPTDAPPEPTPVATAALSGEERSPAEACQTEPSSPEDSNAGANTETVSGSAPSKGSDSSPAGRAELAAPANDTRDKASPDPAPSARSSAPADDGDLLRQIRRLGDRLIETGERLRTDDLRDPRAYDLLRHGLWLHLKALPPVVAGKTAIANTSPSALRQLAALRAADRWDEAIDLAERLVVRHRLDLDLQRTTAQSLLKLDPPAKEAAAAVRARTQEFVARFPGALDLRSREGTPLADSDTRRWLLDPPSALPSSRQPAVPGGAATAGRRHTAQSATADERPSPDHGPPHEGDEPRFIEGLELAEEALRGGQRGLASALFSGLETTVEHHHLDRWRPDLARRVVAGALLSGTNPADPASPQARRLGVLSPRTLAGILAPAG